MKLKMATSVLLLLITTVVHAATVEQAESLLQQGHAEQALEIVNKQLETEPADWRWLFLKARSLTALDRPEQAEQLYRKLIALQPNQPRIYNNLAAILMRQGRMKEAGQVLEQALTGIDPVYATLYQNLQAVNLEIARGSYAEALRIKVPSSRTTLKLLELLPVQAATPNKPEQTGVVQSEAATEAPGV